MGRDKPSNQSKSKESVVEQPLLHTVKFLSKKGNTVKKLVEAYNLKRNNHSYYPTSVFALKYDMNKSPWSSQIVQECRGLVLEQKSDQYRVIAYPYKKFFNYNESHAARIDWKTARVYEKLDGSLCTLYYYEDEWWVSSSGTPCGSGMLETCNKKFRDLFWDVWKKLGYKLPEDTTKCYMFELFSYRNIIIVRPDNPQEERIVLHGVRCMLTFEEQYPDAHAEKHGWECIKSYPLTNLTQVLQASNELNPIKNEGFIVCDANFNRVKVKSPQYVALAHLSGRPDIILGKLNRRSMLQIVRFHEGDEFLSYFPQYKDLHTLCFDAYKQFVAAATRTLASQLTTIPLPQLPNTEYLLGIYTDEWKGILGDESVEICRSSKKVARILRNHVVAMLTTILQRYCSNTEKVEQDEQDIAVPSVSSLETQVMSYYSKSAIDKGDFYKIVYLSETITDVTGSTNRVRQQEDDNGDFEEFEDSSQQPNSSSSEDEQDSGRSKRGRTKKDKNKKKKSEEPVDNNNSRNNKNKRKKGGKK